MKFAALVGLVAGLWCYHLASGVIHSWKGFFTGSFGLTEFPEFVAVNYLDDEIMTYFDSKTNSLKIKQSWIQGTLGQTYEDRENNALRGWSETMKNNVRIAMGRFNHTQGLHVLQWMYGCQLDDDNGATDSSFQYGYDGEDFFLADLKNMRWIAPVSQALPTKQKYDSGKEMERWKAYAESECIDWIKKYVSYGSSVLGRKVPPEITIFKKDSSSGIVCHATGFYPDGVMITWKRNGVEMQEDTDVGETLSNADGTFQKRVVLTVSSEEWKKSQYTCEVAHKSGSFERTLNPDELDNGGSNSIGLIVGLVILGIFSLIACIAGFFWCRQRNSGFVPANTKDDGSASSDESPRGV